ncbi:MAG: NADH:flavin oxidoreductase [Dethiosulfatibacter sp.]|nr:NADH:flavin oxidoreductase [Dethiosulfatibacter sp.]
MQYLTNVLQTDKITLKNRLIMAPLATSKSNEDGTVSDDVLAYYNEKSQGGYVSLFVIEHSYILQQGKASANQMSVANDSVMEGLKQLATTIHNNGSKAVMQINFAGSASKSDITGELVLGPSEVVNPLHGGEVPRAMSKEDINKVVEAFGRAATRVKEAGFDGVEIHSAHGYLLNQFFSPLTNMREDEYGGGVRNRIRIHLEVINAVRDAVGEEFPILLRLAASDYKDGGITIDDSKIAAIEFEKAGVDILDISGGFCGYTRPGVREPGYFSPLTEEIKKVISIPVILTGGIKEANEAEKLLKDGKADLIGVARAIFKDSKWAERAITGDKVSP